LAIGRGLYDFFITFLPTLYAQDFQIGDGAPLTERAEDWSVTTMWDLGCLIASVAFFLISIAYIAGCDRLAAKETR